jgi:hypothetical protein
MERLMPVGADQGACAFLIKPLHFQACMLYSFSGKNTVIMMTEKLIGL